LNILNIGRCSRCIASKQKIVNVEAEIKNIKGEVSSKITGNRKWLYCVIKDDFCRHIAKNCKEPPMGISAIDYQWKIKNGSHEQVK